MQYGKIEDIFGTIGCRKFVENCPGLWQAGPLLPLAILVNIKLVASRMGRTFILVQEHNHVSSLKSSKCLQRSSVTTSAAALHMACGTCPANTGKNITSWWRCPLRALSRPLLRLSAVEEAGEQAVDSMQISRETEDQRLEPDACYRYVAVVARTLTRRLYEQHLVATKRLSRGGQ